MQTKFDHAECRERLARSHTLAEMARTYQDAENEITDSVRRLESALATLEQMFGGGARRDFRLSDQCGRVVYLDTGSLLVEIRRSTWRALSDRLGVRSMMSVRRAQQLDHELTKANNWPPVTEDNLRTFVNGYLSALPELLTEAVSEVFDWLRPRAGTRRAQYATNNAVEVGARCILGYACDTHYGFRLREDTSRHLTALENVVTSLDGKGQIVKGHRSALEMALYASESRKAETEYFRARCFKNGNMHLEFKRTDLLAKFNALAGGKHLRPRSQA